MSQDAINISLIHPFRRFTPGSCSWPHTSPTLHLRNGAGPRSGRRWVGTRHEPTDGPCESPVCRSFRSSHSSFVPSVTHSLRSFFPSVP